MKHLKTLDWCEEQGGRLPTLVELSQAREEVDGFIASSYWSATEANANTAYNVYFSNCTTYYMDGTTITCW